MSGSSTESARAPTLFKHVERAEFAEKPFVVLGDDCLTYGALRDCMARTAHLFANLGIGPRDRVVICSELEIEVIALYLAAMRLGVTPALIDPQSSPGETASLVRAAQARALFADDRVLSAGRLEDELLPGGRALRIGRGGRYQGSGLVASADRGSSATFPAMLLSLDPLALPQTIPGEISGFILFTSGTTSRPKGVEVSHAAIAAHMVTMHRQYGYGEDSVILNGLPLHHSDGINHGAVNVMAAGATLYRTGAFSVQQLPKILNLVSHVGITHMITVPTVLALIARLGKEFNSAFRQPAFRFISSTAGPLDERLWRAFEERFGTMLVNSYGLTETICEGFYCGPTAETRRIGTIGKPIDIDVRIIDASGRDVAQGEMGELILRGDCVMKGYFNAPEETQAVLRDGWLHTGDLAVCDSDGFFLITGRKKNVVISGGINVYPEDVSRAISRMHGVVDVVTLGVPDEIWGERVVSCVVAEEAWALSSEAVVDYCRAHLSRERVPSHVFMLDELPRGPSGKVALPQVRKIVMDRLAAETAHAGGGARASGDNVKRRVLELAANCFRTSVEELSLESESETTAGWNSLAHMDFLLSLEATFGLRIAPADMLSVVTLGDAVAYVSAALTEAEAKAQ